MTLVTMTGALRTRHSVRVLCAGSKGQTGGTLQVSWGRGSWGAERKLGAHSSALSS